MMQIQPRARLWKAIKEAGLNQRTFARLIGEHESIVSRVVNGSMNLPPSKAMTWAKVLGQPVERLFGE
jgi:plasmid maintenance system antidote protein VapI